MGRRSPTVPRSICLPGLTEAHVHTGSEVKRPKTTTTKPAKILRVDDRVGRLEPGKEADFFVFGGDPWDDRNKVQATCTEGEMVFEVDGPHLPD